MHVKGMPDSTREKDCIANKKLGELCFLMICVAGFLYQVFGVSLIYFEYDTVSSIQFVMEPSAPLPKLAVCLTYSDVINSHQIKSLTVNEIFSLTPEADSAVISVSYRTKDTLLTSKGVRDGPFNSQTKALVDIISVDKFLHDVLVCYRISWFDTRSIEWYFSASSIQTSGVLYSIVLNKTAFGSASKIRVVPYHGTYPYGSYFFSPVIDRWANNKSDDKNTVNHVVVGYAVLNVSLLHPPYKPTCSHNAETSRGTCLLNCFTRELSKFDRIPPQVVVNEPSDMKRLSEQDLLSNETVHEEVTQRSKYCLELCSYLLCDYDTTLTTPIQTIVGGDELRVTVTVDQAPERRIASMPRLETEEFVVYICSCFGIWFGLSVIRLNPSRLAHSVWIKRRRTQVVRDLTSVSGTENPSHSTNKNIPQPFE